jgi:hypothetical protein
VVEPREYDPKSHMRIFSAAINVFIEPNQSPVDSFTSVVDQTTTAGEHFDLVTFPEAFLPAKGLIEILEYIGTLDKFGCVHVGLRPSADDPNHLFMVSEIEALLTDIRKIPEMAISDLEAFSEWLINQENHFRFNIGCLFTLDSDRRIRVCLHPKLVQSKYEISPLAEKDMAEGNLLTIVTLRPTNMHYKTVTVQPLLCSDALHLSTKHAGSRPLEALQKDADSLAPDLPDHIDVVSVPTCTKQQQRPSKKADDSFYRMWHSEFRDTFCRAAHDDSLARHHFATFVLSNFRMIPGNEPAGLSGAFIPVPIGRDPFPDYISLSCYGRPTSLDDNRWSTPEENCFTRPRWETLGYVAGLNPFYEADAIARMLGFAVHQFPRDQSNWREKFGLTSCTLKLAQDQGLPPSLAFV